MDPIDELVVKSLRRFLEDLGPKRWKGREKDAVSMFAMGPLVEVMRLTNSPLTDVRQIGVEVAVDQKFKGSTERASKARANKDLVIWKESCSTAWSTPSGKAPVVLAVLEWKVDCDQKGNAVSAKEKIEMQKWLKGFAGQHREAIGFGVYLDLRSNPKKSHKLERFQGEGEPLDWTHHLLGESR